MNQKNTISNELEREKSFEPFVMELDLSSGEASADIKNVGAAGVLYREFLEPVNGQDWLAIRAQLLGGTQVKIQDEGIDYFCDLIGTEGELLTVQVTPVISQNPPEREKPVEQMITTVSEDVDLVLHQSEMATQVKQMTTRIGIFRHEVKGLLANLSIFVEHLDDDRTPPLVALFKDQVQGFMHAFNSITVVPKKSIEETDILAKMIEAQNQISLIQNELVERLGKMATMANAIARSVSIDAIEVAAVEKRVRPLVKYIFKNITTIVQRMQYAQQSMDIFNPRFDLQKNLNVREVPIEYVKESLTEVAQRLNRPQDLELDLQVENLHVGPEYFTQALVNLLQNGFSFSKEGTPVRVSASETKDSVVFLVADSGPGVPEEDRKKIFKKFRQSSQGGRLKDEHSGLGLAIVKKIVKAHGGKVSVGDVQGGGAEFRVVIPKPEA